MGKFDWKKLVGTLAPTIATALGGPLAGAATVAISKAVLGKDNGTDGEIEAALAVASPELLLKLKEADNTFKLEMERLGVDLEKIHAGDRDSARKRAMAMNDHSPVAIGVLIVGFWGFISWQLLTMAAPPAIGDFTVGRILGMLDSALLAFLYYIYGSSSGSKAKTDALTARGDKS